MTRISFKSTITLITKTGKGIRLAQDNLIRVQEDPIISPKNTPIRVPIRVL